MKIKERGFTLIELLGILVVLSLILLVAVPAMVKSNKDSKDREYTRVLKDLYIATENYVESNRDKYPELNNVGGKIYITLNELYTAELIKNNVVNPITDELIPYTHSISVTVNANKTFAYNYEGLHS